MKQFQFEPLKPKKVLAIGAHPDDIDFCAGGTIALFAAQGADVRYLQITDGSCGSNKPNMSCKQVAAMRRKEQKAACQIIGGSGVKFLNHHDGTLEVTMKLKSQICEVIRDFQPDVVITMDPTMVYSAEQGIINHPDHRATGQAVLDSVYPLARDHLSLPRLFKRGLKPHKVDTVLLINFNEQNYYVDIGDTFETKIAATQAHKSQIPDEQAMNAMFKSWAERAGKQSGYHYAESFVRIDMKIWDILTIKSLLTSINCGKIMVLEQAAGIYTDTF